MTLCYLLDTNIISEPLRPLPDQAVLNHLREHQAEIAIASVVWHELWYGSYRLPASTKRSVIEGSDDQWQVETPDQVALSLPLAGVGGRGLAALVDLLAVFFCWMVGLFVYSIWGDLLGRWQALSWAGQLLMVGAILAAGWGWDVAWEVAWNGQTPGKRALGLRVVRLDGAPVGLPESLVRNALRVVELPLGYAPAVLAVAFSARRQRLGDLVAGTLVVQERRFDLSRYGAPAAAEARWRELKGRAPGLLAPADFERLLDFLRRRGDLDEAPRARLAARLAAALAARAGVAPPGAGEAESFLEALHAFAAEAA